MAATATSAAPTATAASPETALNASGRPNAPNADWRTFPAAGLSGKYLDLVPLNVAAHMPALWKAGGSDPTIWRYHPFAPDTFKSVEEMTIYYTAMIEKGGWVVCVVLDKQTREPVGSYAFMDIQPLHRAHEIGSVWISSSAQKGILNTEAVLLLLKYSFTVLGCYRVCWKTDSRNVISQAVATKLGATKEGVLRSHYVIKGGYRRDTVYYSWLDTEWKATETALTARVQQFVPLNKSATATAAAAAPSAAAAAAVKK